MAAGVSTLGFDFGRLPLRLGARGNTWGAGSRVSAGGAALDAPTGTAATEETDGWPALTAAGGADDWARTPGARMAAGDTISAASRRWWRITGSSVHSAQSLSTKSAVAETNSHQIVRPP